MSLLYKFVSIVLLILLSGLVATGFVACQQLENFAENQVKQQAKLMMRAALATRDYTKNHIKGLVEKIPQTDEFVREAVPAFAATTTLNFIQEHPEFKNYRYSEPSQKPTNPDDRAEGDEIKLLKWFRKNPKNEKGELNERWEVWTELGESYWVYARPFIAEKDCLRCHDTPAQAPPLMVNWYHDNGFGWVEGEVEAAQIVRVPKSEPARISKQALLWIIGTMVLFTVLTLLALGLALERIVIRPVARLSEMADQLSRGNLSQGELPVHGNDEIATLTGSFNRMSVSLSKAMKMLEENQ